MKFIITLTILLITSYLFAQNNINQEYSFIKNEGQYDGRNWNSNSKIEYGYNHNPFYVFLSNQGHTYRFDKMIKNPKRKQDPTALPKRMNVSEIINVTWEGANDNVLIIPTKKINPYYSFALQTASGDVNNINNIPGYQTITYKNLYDKIDVEYNLHPEGGVKYNIILHPGADPSVLKLKYKSAHTNSLDEKIDISLNDQGQLIIKTSQGKIVEHAPITFYADNKNQLIKSSYSFKNNVLSFNVADYDHTKEVVIDPWIIAPNFTTSSAVWEVETDAAGNIYSIGGETPMELKKYDPAGNLLWSYITPWDTNSVWLGTLATDPAGNSFITSGTSPTIQRVNTAGGLVWSNNHSSISGPAEFWTITFNCDYTKLIVGGTESVTTLIVNDFWGAVFDIDINNGDILNTQLFDQVTLDLTAPPGFNLPTPIEVRSIASSQNSQYVYLTHTKVGKITENFTFCTDNEPIFDVDNQKNLGYKCENFLPANQNGGGLKGIIAGEDFFYTHSGDEIRQWDILTGDLINTVAIPGGVSNTTPFGGGNIMHCSGLSIDDCGNIYAGSTNQVVQFDLNLNILSSQPTVFAVYDVDVNSNGEVIACGAQQNNSATNRNGRIQSLNFSSCAQFSIICCDANFCNPGPLCVTDAPVNIEFTQAGGTWSGPGVNASGVFDPSLAGVGEHIITYTLACGTEEQTVLVSPCQPLEACLNPDGTISITNGAGTIVWEEELPPSSSPISSQADCESCGFTWFPGIPPFVQPSCLDGVATVTTCNDPGGSSQFATGVTVLPGTNFPITVTDGAGFQIIINALSDLSPCTVSPCTSLTVTITSENDVTCNGDNDGSATINAADGNGTYTYTWTPGGLNGATQSNLSPGNYTVDVVDSDGCAGSVLVEITEPTAIVASATETDATCGNNDGEIALSVSGGAAGYSYAWSNGATTQNITGLAPGAYSVTITDGNGCTEVVNATVDALNGPTITLDTSADASCNGDTDGSATVSATGGSGGYTYNWLPGNLTGATQSNLGAGDYDVTVTDSDGCPSTITITIDEPASIDLTTSSLPSSCTVDDGSATVVATGGAGGFTYSWTPVAGSNATLTNIGAGAYTVTVTDANGCSEQATANVSSINGPVVTIDSSTDPTCNGESDGAATIAVSGGTPGYTYSWSPSGGTAATENNLGAGVYTVTVTDNAGCISLIDVTLGEPDAIAITGTSVDATCADNDGSIDVIASGGDGNFTYAWTPSGTGANPTGLAPGTYDVIVTDGNGCTAQSSFVVGLDNTLLVDIVPDSPVIGIGDEVTLNVTTIPGTSNPTYSWSPSEGLSCDDCPNPIASPSETTTYTVTVTDDNGCTGQATVTIFVEQPCGEVLVPNIFSPNGDGNNDLLCVLGNCIVEMEFSIFNRWGEKIFESTNPADCWDGTYKAKPVNTGVFVYKLITVNTDGEEIINSGNITLVR